ncbi:MAG: C40 family peptidase [Chitinophagaceae bacterium]
MYRKTIIFTKKLLLVVLTVQFFASCMDAQQPSDKPIVNKDSINTSKGNYVQPVVKPYVTAGNIETGNIKPADVLAFAKSQMGVPYLYASTDPANGFDCSGFITYVFNHFNIAVPRSSVDFTNVGTEVEYSNAKPGDLILFTGTDSTIRIVGHMGLVESNQSGALTFIHSTSGKAKGVVITEFGNYYKSRFVKIIRIFPDQFFHNN